MDKLAGYKQIQKKKDRSRLANDSEVKQPINWAAYAHNVGLGIFIAAFIGSSMTGAHFIEGIGFLLFDLVCLSTLKSAFQKKKFMHDRIIRRARLARVHTQ